MKEWGIGVGTVLVLVAGYFFLGPKIYARYFLEDFACEPAVSGFTRAEAPSPAASSRLAELFEEDQADRRALGALLSPEELMDRDTQRRHETLRHINVPALHSEEDFYHAAMIFHHGLCSDHFKLAHGLATESMELGYEKAKWLYASTLDRYLRKIGHVQRFGTQYDQRGRCSYVLGRVDSATTDQDRKRFNVPTLAEARALADTLSEQCRE